MLSWLMSCRLEQKSGAINSGTPGLENHKEVDEKIYICKNCFYFFYRLYHIEN